MGGDLPVEMEGMESVVPVVYRQLDIGTVGVRYRIGLLTVNGGIGGIVAHRQCSEVGGGTWFSESPTQSATFLTTTTS